MSVNGAAPATQRIEFPPLQNGLDYVQEVVKDLAGTPTPRNLKYAVLHLQAAVEVLLKVRLIREHWTLVYKDANKADRARFALGDFTSIGMDETLVRLDKVADVTVNATFKTSVKDLADARNRLQHMGLSGSAELIETIASKVLDGLVEFIRTHLRAGADDPDDDDAVEEVLDALQPELDRLRGLIIERMRKVNEELTGVREVVECPNCRQLALRLGTEECLYCHAIWLGAAEELAMTYAEQVLGRSTYEAVTSGGEEPVEECFECETRAMVFGVLLREVADPVAGCFSCGEAVDREQLRRCDICSQWMIPDEDGVAVHDACLSDLANAD